MNYGWTEGEALRMGGLKKPILVKHKKDSKGLGHNADQQEAWWERVFDGQLKSLEVGGSSSDGISFVQKEIKVSGISKNVSPLYRMFRYGGILEGSLKEVKISVSGRNSSSNSSDSTNEKNKKKSKKEKKIKESKKKEKSKKSSGSSSDGKVSKKSSKSDKISLSSSKKDKKKDKTKKKSKQESRAEAAWIKQVMAQMVEPVKA
ncbi:hypothetical protein D0Z00_002483 [Geotrichum galactomycetum]|uniref:Uncharacterized protein n=1 Tax=Geotrichum galactomycetum TaxID=27317 RepID=A0ACB6V3Z1_9ASCO|nr:hypothetical protein D0Z00_002483 [Geotrichum candidum]